MVEEAQGKQTGPNAQGKTNGTQESTSDVTKEPMAVLGH